MAQGSTISKVMLWTGRVLTALPVLLVALGLYMTFAQPEEMQKGFDKYGYPPAVLHPIFYVEIACIVLYLIPQTAVLGAILFTGYLGGAVATHVRVGEPWFLPVIVGIVAWLGIYLRDPKLRSLVPLRW